MQLLCNYRAINDQFLNDQCHMAYSKNIKKSNLLPIFNINYLYFKVFNSYTFG